MACRDENGDDVNVVEGRAILKLPAEVVNKIAAGEVVVRPCNALKEMMENSLDAKSTKIVVTLLEGGVKSLSISDNGTGIHPDDMPVVCQRFTTSKITDFQDLSSLRSFGFRGEALASISHVAHLSITSMLSTTVARRATRASTTSGGTEKVGHGGGEDLESENLAYHCRYEDGEPIGAATVVAGRPGTTITYTDLFYNMPGRLRALGSPTEEFHRILEFMQKMAVHFPTVNFTCKKSGSRSADLCAGGTYNEDEKESGDQTKSAEHLSSESPHGKESHDPFGGGGSSSSAAQRQRIMRRLDASRRVVNQMFGACGVGDSLLPFILDGAPFGRRLPPRKDVESKATEPRRRQERRHPRRQRRPRGDDGDSSSSSGDADADNSDEGDSGDDDDDAASRRGRSRKRAAPSAAATTATFSCFGLISEPNAAPRRHAFILFINDRLVDCNALKRSVELCWSDLLPKGRKPWVYLSLTIPPHLIDPNVHPTKREVIIFDEASVVDTITAAVREHLMHHSDSRKFAMTVDTVGGRQNAKQHRHSSHHVLSSSSLEASTATPGAKKTPLQPTRVRVDASQSNLKSFLTPSQLPPASQAAPISQAVSANGGIVDKTDTQDDSGQFVSANTVEGRPYELKVTKGDLLTEIPRGTMMMTEEVDAERRDRVRRSLGNDHENEEGNDDHKIGAQDTSDNKRALAIFAAAQLLKRSCAAAAGQTARKTTVASAEDDHPSNRGSAVIDMMETTSSRDGSSCSGVTQVLTKSVWVGAVSCRQALLQHEEGLYLFDIIKVTRETVYQSVLDRICCLPSLTFKPPLPVARLLMAAQMYFNAHPELQHPLDNILDSTKRENDDPEELASRLDLANKFLNTAFSIHIEDGHLHRFPRCLGSYFPGADLLAFFLLRLATEVHWKQPTNSGGPLSSGASGSHDSRRVEVVARLLADYFTALPPHAPPQPKSERQSSAPPPSANNNDDDDDETSGIEKISVEQTSSASSAKRKSHFDEDDLDNDDDDDDDEQLDKSNAIMEEIFFASIRWNKGVIYPRSWAEDGTLQRIATLKQLYRSFERC